MGKFSDLWSDTLARERKDYCHDARDVSLLGLNLWSEDSWMETCMVRKRDAGMKNLYPWARERGFIAFSERRWCVYTLSRDKTEKGTNAGTCGKTPTRDKPKF